MLRSKLERRNSGPRIGGPQKTAVPNFGALRLLTPAFPRPTRNLFQWKLHRWLAVKGVFFGQSGRCGHGTPDAVSGDRDVTYMSISRRSDLSVPLSVKHLKTNGTSYARRALLCTGNTVWQVNVRYDSSIFIFTLKKCLCTETDTRNSFDGTSTGFSWTMH